MGRQAKGSRKHLLEGGAAGGGARDGRLRQDRARNARRHVELVRRVQRLAAPADVERRHQGGGAVPQRDLQGARKNPKLGAAGPPGRRVCGRHTRRQRMADHMSTCGHTLLPLSCETAQRHCSS